MSCNSLHVQRQTRTIRFFLSFDRWRMLLYYPRQIIITNIFSFFFLLHGVKIFLVYFQIYTYLSTVFLSNEHFIIIIFRIKRKTLNCLVSYITYVTLKIAFNITPQNYRHTNSSRNFIINQDRV